MGICVITTTWRRKLYCSTARGGMTTMMSDPHNGGSRSGMTTRMSGPHNGGSRSGMTTRMSDPHDGGSRSGMMKLMSRHGCRGTIPETTILGTRLHGSDRVRDTMRAYRMIMTRRRKQRHDDGKKSPMKIGIEHQLSGL
jgi:hypothetical protein